MKRRKLRKTLFSISRLGSSFRKINFDKPKQLTKRMKTKMTRTRRTEETKRELKELALRSNRLQPANPLTNPKRKIEACAHTLRALGSEVHNAVLKTKFIRLFTKN